MKPDSPIVAEVRRARARIAARFGYDLHKYCQYLMKEQEEAAKAATTQVRRGRKEKLTEHQIDEQITSRPAFKASVRKARRDHAEGRSIPLAEAKRRLGV